MTQGFDPLMTSELIIGGYRRYLRSLLPIRDARIAAALTEEISRSPLTKGPLLESAPPYASGTTLADLIAQGVLNPAFASLGSAPPEAAKQPDADIHHVGRCADR